MVNLEIRNELPEECIVFDNPSYDNSIVGVSQDGNAIYNYELMVEELMADGFSEEDAADFVSYNTIRSLTYVNEGNMPIILYPIYK